MSRHWRFLLPMAVLLIVAGLVALTGRRHVTKEAPNDQCTTPPLPVSPPLKPPEARKIPTAPPGPVPAPPQPEAPPVAETEDEKPARLLWEIRTAGGPDFFSEILPLGNLLIGMRDGALHCLDSRTGKVIWKYPEHDAGWQTFSGACLPMPQLIGIVGDEVIAPYPEALREDDAAGCVGFRLADGAMTHRHPVGRRYMYEGVPGAGNQAAFKQYESATPPRKMTVTVVDLQRWRDAATFTLPLPACKMRVRGNRVFGFMRDDEQQTLWAFTVDIKKCELFRMLVQDNPADYALLDDGSRILGEGVFSATCAYERPWPSRGAPWPGTLHVAGPAVYVRDVLSFCRVDPATGGALWSCPLGLTRGCTIAASAELAACLEGGLLQMFSAKDGTLRAVVPLERLGLVTTEWWYTRVACGQKRVYVATRNGLWAFSARALNPEAPDLSDPAEPASALAACREALVQENYEKALKSLHGIARMVRLRPAQRGEVADLLSQLARSPATSQFPELWEDVTLQEGWAAGGLFLADYMRLAPTNEHAVAALLLLGTRPALAAAAALVDGPPRALEHAGRGEGLSLALDAAERVTGRRPYDKLLAKGGYLARHAVTERPIETEALKGLMPKLWDPGQNKYMVQGMPPEQAVMFLEWQPAPNEANAQGSKQKNTPAPGTAQVLQIAKQQLESRAKGTGQREPIHVDTLDQTPPHGEF